MLHNVVQVVPCEDYKVYVYFEDGKIVCYDATGLLEKKAKDSVTVVEGNYNASVHWGREITRSELAEAGFYVNSRY